MDPILEGDYLVCMVLAPEPGGRTSTSQPVTTPAIHLTVTRYTRLNPWNVVPLAIGMPPALTAVWLGLRALRRRETGWASPTPG